MWDSLLACTVRGCGRPLSRAGRALTCERGHSYDVARRGYINLLQPQDRRSLAAGDQKDIVAARSRLIAAGAGKALVDSLVECVSSLDLPELPQVVDLGCGTGHVLAGIDARCVVRAAGIDISAAAIGQAARAHPALTWVVANADRRLPLIEASVWVVLSLHGRRSPEECARVLAPGSFLIVAVPAPDDLIELRAAVQGVGVARDRTGALITAHAPFFDVVRRDLIRERQHLTSDALTDLLRITYRGARHSAASAASGLAAMDVTFASDVLVFARRAG